MSLKDDLEAGCRKIFSEVWSSVDKTVVPEPADIPLGNHAGHFAEMTVLYADLNGSTTMVDLETWQFSAEVYKSYLHCAAKIIKNQGGVITAYDGDRIMAVFIGDSKNTNAVRAALMINYAVINIVNPSLKGVYSSKNFSVRHTVGVDTSTIHVARIGVKNDNDLVWVGKAANHAAKLTAISNENLPIRISSAIYGNMNESVHKSAATGLSIWEKRTWTEMGNSDIYMTSGWYSFT
jgi:class 3 adenylate cyclase